MCWYISLFLCCLLNSWSSTEFAFFPLTLSHKLCPTTVGVLKHSVPEATTSPGYGKRASEKNKCPPPLADCLAAPLSGMPWALLSHLLPREQDTIGSPRCPQVKSQTQEPPPVRLEERRSHQQGGRSICFTDGGTNPEMSHRNQRRKTMEHNSGKPARTRGREWS